MELTAEVLLIPLIAVVVIALTTALAPRIGIAGPLVLVLIGAGVGLIPGVSVPQLDPEIILVGVLPPLLYSAAVSLPALEFRRDFGPIAGLSFLLVIISSLAVGGFLMLVIPGIGFALAVAVGAILSPTDAVATGIVKRLGVSPRVVTMLEGESLLNDATALVLLRTMIAATAIGVAAGDESAIGVGFLGAFAWGVVAAATVGALVGYGALRLRGWVRNNPAANTAIGIVVPFVAYLPTEALGGSGLVAAVVAGIVTGQGAPRWFSPEQRMSDRLNWRTIELLLEGAVFLLMGLELYEIVRSNMQEHNGIGVGLGIAAGAFVLVMVVRAVYVALLVWLQSTRARGRQRQRLEAMSERIDEISARPETGSPRPVPRTRRRSRRLDMKANVAAQAAVKAGRNDPEHRERRLQMMRSRVARALSDLNYYDASPLGWKHGTVIVWAGMRGVVTLAAAQTLPRETPDRALLVFIAFAVAVGSLMLQGFTIGPLVKALRLRDAGDDAMGRAERSALDAELRQGMVDALESGSLRRSDGARFEEDVLTQAQARFRVPGDDDEAPGARERLELHLALLGAMRARLQEISRGGAYSTEALRHALAELDADQLSVQLRLEDAD